MRNSQKTGGNVRVDHRAGSRELIAPLQSLGLPVESAVLPAGDVEILGSGPDGCPLLVGVELKKLPDLIACVRNGRFAEQLRAMRETYQISWLLIEGRLKGVGKDEQLRVLQGLRWFDQPGHVSYQEIASWALTMALRGGVLTWRTESQEETVEWLRTLNHWLTAKEWSEHRAHLDWYEPEPEGANPFTGPGLVQRVAAVLPGVGSVRSANVAAHFRTVKEMIDADEVEWQKVDGVGKKGASTLVKAVTGGDK